MSMSYASIDPQIQDWIQRHTLKLFTSQGERESCLRAAYVSSTSGECFQIWIDPPEEGCVYTACVEGRTFPKLGVSLSPVYARLSIAPFRRLPIGWHVRSFFLLKCQTDALLFASLRNRF